VLWLPQQLDRLGVLTSTCKPWCLAQCRALDVESAGYGCFILCKPRLATLSPRRRPEVHAGSVCYFGRPYAHTISPSESRLSNEQSNSRPSHKICHHEVDHVTLPVHSDTQLTLSGQADRHTMLRLSRTYDPCTSSSSHRHRSRPLYKYRYSTSPDIYKLICRIVFYSRRLETLHPGNTLDLARCRGQTSIFLDPPRTAVDYISSESAPPVATLLPSSEFTLHYLASKKLLSD